MLGLAAPARGLAQSADEDRTNYRLVTRGPPPYFFALSYCTRSCAMKGVNNQRIAALSLIVNNNEEECNVATVIANLPEPILTFATQEAVFEVLLKEVKLREKGL